MRKVKAKTELGKVLLRDISLTELSKRTNIDATQISRWINYRVKPSITACKILSRYTGVSVDEIIGLWEGGNLKNK